MPGQPSPSATSGCSSLSGRIPAQAQSAFGFPFLLHRYSSFGLRGGGQSPESHAGTAPGAALREEKSPTPLHPGPQLCDFLGLLPTAPRLTTGSGRPLIKSKCNLSCPNADSFEKGRINCGGKEEIILNKCHLDYKMECVLCLAQFSSSF